jgi:hypothetical protein
MRLGVSGRHPELLRAMFGILSDPARSYRRCRAPARAVFTLIIIAAKPSRVETRMFFPRTGFHLGSPPPR